MPKLTASFQIWSAWKHTSALMLVLVHIIFWITLIQLVLRINLLTEKTAANKHSDIFSELFIIYIRWSKQLRYFSYNNISYQMYKTRSCWTFYHSLKRFLQGNDSRVSTSWKWFNIEVYTRSTWFHFELDLSQFSGFLLKKTLVKKNDRKNYLDKQEKFWKFFKILRKKHKNSKPFGLF